MASLTGTKIKDTYDALLKVSDNGALDGTLQTITDGLGNNSSLSLSTAGASVTGTLNVSGNATFDTTTLFVDASNNRVAVGTTNAQQKLHIQDAGPVSIRLNDSTTNYWDLTNDSNLIFKRGGTERMRIDVSGAVGIGTSPSAKLHIQGTNSGVLVDTSVAYTPKIKASGALSDLEISSIGNGGNLILTADCTSGSIIQFNNGGSEAARIDSSGNFGIGTTSPAAKLEIYKSDFPAMRLSNANAFSNIYQDTAGVINYSADDGGTAANSGHIFYVDGIERMRVTSGGAVLIKTQSEFGISNEALQVANIDGGDRAIAVGNTTGSSATGCINFYNSNGIVGAILTNGSSTSYLTSSDYRLKEDWQPMANALDRVEALKPINFAWKVDGSRVDGFLAHELAEVVPEAVTGEKDATEIRSFEVSPAVYEDVIHPAKEAILDEEGNVIQEAKEEWVEKVLVSEAVFEDQEFPVYQGIDQSKIVPLLVAAIQELRAEIELLKSQING